MKDINTFRFKKAKFYDEWESNILFSSFKLITELPMFILDIT